MYYDLTRGSISKSLFFFALPMMAGNLLQQFISFSIVISLGLRVLLAYVLSGVIGVTGIWIAIPIGWLLADAVGLLYMKKTLN